MLKSYVPIMAAKRGEFTALSHLTNLASQRIMPLFELPQRKIGATLIEKPINSTATSAGKAWSGNGAYLDISKWKPHDRTESGIHVLEFAYRQFKKSGVNVQPVIGYDRWDDPAYKSALRNILFSNINQPCIRIDRESIKDDVPDDAYFEERMSDIVEELSLSPENCPVILDFGQVASLPLPELISYADTAINSVKRLGFKSVVIAGGSMPSAVNEAVEAPDTEGCIPRIEMMGWKAITSAPTGIRVAFGDYLIRCPSAAEGIIAPHANAKIRYTINNQYYIVRGHSKKFDSLTSQNKDLANKLISSGFYTGNRFSWGDTELMNCAINVTEVRDPTKMIAIDSNRHISVVVNEIQEHQLTTNFREYLETDI